MKKALFGRNGAATMKKGIISKKTYTPLRLSHFHLTQKNIGIILS
jgi:hypothetical protein